MKKQRIWLITGASSGLGKALTEAVLAAGEIVVATFRTPAQADSFQQKDPENHRGVVLDVTDRSRAAEVIRDIAWEFERVDVLVNNAGFGFAGAIEEASDSEIRRVMETHFHAALHLTQLVLPLMRKHQAGHIIQISSHGGFRALPGFGIYNASKFALEGFSEALAGELAPLGIKVTLVEPGPFRTDFAGKGLVEAAQIIPDYAQTAGAFRSRLRSVNGKQEGNPHKAAEAIIQVVNHAEPPLRLPLGKIALASIRAKITSVETDLAAWAHIAEDAVFEC